MNQRKMMFYVHVISLGEEDRVRVVVGRDFLCADYKFPNMGKWCNQSSSQASLSPVRNQDLSSGCIQNGASQNKTHGKFCQ